LAGALGSTVGILAVMLFPPDRIPIMIEEQSASVLPDLKAMVDELFPRNMLAVASESGLYMLPLYLLALFLGLGLCFDKNEAKPVVSLAEAISRMFYSHTSLYSEIITPCLIALSAFWAIRYREVLQTEVFGGLILLLALVSLLLVFVILPLCFYLFGSRSKPLLRVYAALGPVIAAFFSGDINFSLPILLRNSGENLGVKRRINSPVLAIFTSFGRSGSAMVAAVAFIVIIRSYSSLGLTTANLVSIGLEALLISLLLARNPGDGAYVALMYLAVRYGQGFEAGYLIMKPIAFYLIAIGAFVDIAIAGYASFAIGKMSGAQEDKPIKQYV
jgi:Na+/H+-dicarboxylate symporter